METYSSIAAVDRACQVLEALVGQINGLSVSELEDKTKISKSNISRILTTLRERGYVEQDSDTRFYKLSLDFLSLTYRHINTLDMEDMFHPLLKRVTTQTNELSQLAVVKKEGIFFVGKMEGISPLKVASMLGQKAPLHAAAVGKVWLASLSNEEILYILGKKGLRAYTSYTITNLGELLEDLDKVRKKGYAISDEELNLDVFAIAFPIYNNDTEKKVIASLVITIPKFKLNDKLLENIINVCEEEINKFDASLLSPLNLGYQPKLSIK